MNPTWSLSAKESLLLLSQSLHALILDHFTLKFTFSAKAIVSWLVQRKCVTPEISRHICSTIIP